MLFWSSNKHKKEVINLKFYIDFDHTLYNTNALISDMLEKTSEYILCNGNFKSYQTNFKNMFPSLEILPIEENKESILYALRSNFKRPEETYLGIEYNIYALINTFAKLFSCDTTVITKNLNKLLDDGQKYLYDDSVSFLKKLKSAGHEVYILSHERTDLDYQNKKILGAQILQNGLIDAIIVTKISKATLNVENYNNSSVTSITYAPGAKPIQNEVDYLNGIFLDDRPKDLEALYESAYSKELPNILKVRIFRIARPNGTYANKPLDEHILSNGIIKVSSPTEIFNFIDLL